MISLSGVEKSYGANTILDGVGFRVLPTEKLGLVGPNGGGKSTIAKLILREEDPTAGTVVVDRGVRIGYVPQYPVLPLDLTVESYLLGPVLPMRQKLRALEEAMGEADGDELDRILGEYAKIRDQWDELDGDRLAGTVGAVLGKLGLDGMESRTVATLSGGERNLVSLARAALPEPELLLLDEPGNHLDYRGQDLLEEYLRTYGGAVLVISHNRYLLDRVASGILELQRGSVTRYAGGYSAYRLERLRQASAQQASFVADQKKLARLEALVARFAEIARTTADPKWGKRLRARRTQLSKAREQSTDAPSLARERISVSLADDAGKANIAISVRDYSRAIGDTVLFEDAALTVSVGESVALIGPNGCGKTTFLKDLVEYGDWDNPTLRIGPSARIGYCAQNQEVLPDSACVLDALRSRFALSSHAARDVLGRYRFGGEDCNKKIALLSGGEKNRLQFAYAELTEANLLILDEPTNHMDIVSREVIEDALWEFSGTILVVSHDRYLLEKIAERVVIVQDRGFVSFPGGFSEYVQSLGGYWSKGEVRKARSLAGIRSEDSRPGLEQRITSLESEQRELERKIETAFDAGDHVSGRRLAKRLDRVLRQIDNLYDEWAR